MIRLTKKEQSNLRKLPDGLIPVVLLICEFAVTKKGHANMSQRWMAQTLGQSYRTITKKVSKLKELGLLEIGEGYYPDAENWVNIPYTCQLHRDVLKGLDNASQ